MDLEFKASFAKDLRKVKSKKILGQIKAVVEQLEPAESLKLFQILRS